MLFYSPWDKISPHSVLDLINRYFLPAYAIPLTFQTKTTLGPTELLVLGKKCSKMRVLSYMGALTIAGALP